MDDPLASIRLRFRQRCFDDLEVLRAWSADAPAPELRERIHRLAGMAGTVGFPALSQLAAAVDDVMAHGGRPDAAAICALEKALAEVAAPPKAGGTP